MLLRLCSGDRNLVMCCPCQRDRHLALHCLRCYGSFASSRAGCRLLCCFCRPLQLLLHARLAPHGLACSGHSAAYHHVQPSAKPYGVLCVVCISWTGAPPQRQVLTEISMWYAGVGWVIFRSKEYVPEEIIFHVSACHI